MIDLDSYLVKLGFDVDVVALDSFLNVLEKGKKAMRGSAVEAAKSSRITTGAFMMMAATAAVGMAKIISGVADMDKQLSLSAKKMWMNKEAFTEMSFAAESLGYSLDDLSDIAIDKELRSQFYELVEIGKQLQVPEETLESLKLVRNISFQVKEAFLIVKYSIIDFAASLVKQVSPELKNVGDVMHRINEWLIEISQSVKGTFVTTLKPIAQIVLRAIQFLFELLQRIMMRVPRLGEAIQKIVQALEPIINMAFELIDSLFNLLDVVMPVLDLALSIISDAANLLAALFSSRISLSDISLFGNTREWAREVMETYTSNLSNNYDSSDRSVSITNNTNVYTNNAEGVGRSVANNTQTALNKYVAI